HFRSRILDTDSFPEARRSPNWTKRSMEHTSEWRARGERASAKPGLLPVRAVQQSLGKAVAGWVHLRVSTRLGPEWFYSVDWVNRPPVPFRVAPKLAGATCSSLTRVSGLLPSFAQGVFSRSVQCSSRRQRVNC